MMTSLDLFIKYVVARVAVIPEKGTKEEFIVMNGR